MKSRFSLSRRGNSWLTLVLLALFVALGFFRFTQNIEETGDDLGSSFLGCRLVATGDAPGHLYAHDPVDFAAIGDDDEWQTAADEGGFESWLHPYVQTPLWAWSLQPLCTHLRFPAFDRLFIALTLLSFAAIVALVARLWTPTLRSPLAIALILLALWFSTPFQYAMMLTQTHVLYLLLTLAALMLAERRRPVSAGTLLAVAAAVKLTPAIFLVYWLLTRRWRAAGAFVLVSALLLAAAHLTTGPALFADYLATLDRVSHTLLLSQNNQSLAAWFMGHLYSLAEVAHLRILPLPPALRLLGTALTLAAALLGGLLDRRRAPAVLPPSPIAVPLGALLTLIAATIFTPIAWTHYFIVLMPTLMVLAAEARRRRSLTLALASALILALNLPPLATDVVDITIGPHSILRSQFFSGVLCLATLLAVALTRYRYQPPARPTPT